MAGINQNSVVTPYKFKTNLKLLYGVVFMVIIYWYICFQVDTNLETPKDIVPDGLLFSGSRYNIAPYSSILLEAKP